MLMWNTLLVTRLISNDTLLLDKDRDIWVWNADYMHLGSRLEKGSFKRNLKWHFLGSQPISLTFTFTFTSTSTPSFTFTFTFTCTSTTTITITFPLCCFTFTITSYNTLPLPLRPCLPQPLPLPLPLPSSLSLVGLLYTCINLKNLRDNLAGCYPASKNVRIRSILVLNHLQLVPV